jgi:uncharacterized protein (TIGR00369 family)
MKTELSTPATHARRNAAEQRRFDSALTELFEQRITFNGVLGLKVLSLHVDDVQLRLDMRPDFVGHAGYGRLHGGVISATLDALGGLALMVALGEKHADEDTAQVMHRFGRMGTIDLRIDFLRQGIGSHFVGHAEVTRLGGRIGSVRMRMVNESGLLIATGSAAYVVS